MVKHIVMWNFKQEIKEEDKAKLKADMKANLEGLKGVVPGLLEAVYITDTIPSSTHEMALTTLHETAEDLKAYSAHPSHVAVADTYIRPFVHERCCLDYEVE